VQLNLKQHPVVLLDHQVHTSRLQSFSNVALHCQLDVEQDVDRAVFPNHSLQSPVVLVNVSHCLKPTTYPVQAADSILLSVYAHHSSLRSALNRDFMVSYVPQQMAADGALNRTRGRTPRQSACHPSSCAILCMVGNCAALCNPIISMGQGIPQA
jgi:hypothetical protein